MENRFNEDYEETNFDEKNWTDLSNQDLDAYAKGKTLKDKTSKTLFHGQKGRVLTWPSRFQVKVSLSRWPPS